MAKSSGQKLKILYIMDYLLRNTDEEHPASLAELTAYLEKQEISVRRKTLYDDIDTLRAFGMDIIMTNTGRNYGYYVASRDFELPELKLLVDSVQASKFITQKKTVSLIGKIEKLTSVHRAKALQGQVFVKNRIKTMNESIYYNVDELHGAIADRVKIRFKYFEFTPDKQRRFRRNGDWYVASPYALTWDDENYYLVAYDSDAGHIKHYRVDKMASISAIAEPRDGEDAFNATDMGAYTRSVFGMFAGEPETVLMRFENHLAGAVIDRLGQEVMTIPDGSDHFTVSARVVPSPQFFAWVFGFGAGAQILGPAGVREKMSAQLRAAAELYS